MTLRVPKSALVIRIFVLKAKILSGNSSSSQQHEYQHFKKQVFFHFCLTDRVRPYLLPHPPVCSVSRINRILHLICNNLMQPLSCLSFVLWFPVLLSQIVTDQYWLYGFCHYFTPFTAAFYHKSDPIWDSYSSAWSYLLKHTPLLTDSHFTQNEPYYMRWIRR